MNNQQLAGRVNEYLHRLCIEIPTRTTGTVGNRQVSAYIAARLAGFGWAVETPAFECLDWYASPVRLVTGDELFTAVASPFSLPCSVKSTLISVGDLAELQACEATGKILMLRGDLAREPLMPKSFPWYNPQEHQDLIRLLEQKKPAALVAATTRSSETAGAVYPFPLIEDADIDLPSVYMTAEEGLRLQAHAGKPIELDFQAERRPATGNNVIARKGGDGSSRVVLFAHLDAKPGTPGATDNATGVAILLLLAELLADYAGNLQIELVAMNGEDYYSNPGEKQYLALNEGRFHEILLGINLDGIGFARGATAYTTYECPEPLNQQIQAVLEARPGFIQGEPWYQGDHFLFLINQVPALALTSEKVSEMLAEITHTAQDTPEIVEIGKVVQTALALEALLRMLKV